MAPDARSVGSGAPFDIGQRLRDGRAAVGDFLIPVGGRNRVRHQLLAQLRERIPSPFRCDFALALISLSVLSGMAGKPGHGEPDQGRAIARSYARDGVLNEDGSRLRVRAIAVEHPQPAKALEIARDVSARSLLAGADRNAVAVVLD